MTDPLRDLDAALERLARTSAARALGWVAAAVWCAVVLWALWLR